MPRSYAILLGQLARLAALFLAVALICGVVGRVFASDSTPGDDEVELICHNRSDCYPKVFQATSEFQRVRDDQDLPAGLHVRLNVWTGEKEAKVCPRLMLPNTGPTANVG